MILLTGGSGRLGKELLKLYDFNAPSHSELDITSLESILNWIDNNGTPSLIVHCAAYTDVANAKLEMDKCYDINVKGTGRLAWLKIPMIYISTEYVFDGEKGNYTEEDTPDPVNFYSLTKLLGEFEAKRTTSLIIRTSLKPRPFQHPAACVDQFTSGDYADIIAKELIIAIEAYYEDHNVFGTKILNIGTGRKSIFDLAKQTRDVSPIELASIRVKLPKDTSLNLTRWIAFKEKGKKNDKAV